jgi:hypothetical protein
VVVPVTRPRGHRHRVPAHVVNYDLPHVSRITSTASAAPAARNRPGGCRWYRANRTLLRIERLIGSRSARDRPGSEPGRPTAMLPEVQQRRGQPAKRQASGPEPQLTTEPGHRPAKVGTQRASAVTVPAAAGQGPGAAQWSRPGPASRPRPPSGTARRDLSAPKQRPADRPAATTRLPPQADGGRAFPSRGPCERAGERERRVRVVWVDREESGVRRFTFYSRTGGSSRPRAGSQSILQSNGSSHQAAAERAISRTNERLRDSVCAARRCLITSGRHHSVSVPNRGT